MTIHRELNETLHGIADEAERISDLLDGKFDLEPKDVAEVVKLAQRILLLTTKYEQLSRR